MRLMLAIAVCLGACTSTSNSRYAVTSTDMAKPQPDMIPAPVDLGALAIPRDRIRIWPIGTSQTADGGGAAWGSWRWPLDRMARSAGIAFDFVGSLESPTIPKSNLRSREHDGRNGYYINQITAAIPTAWLTTAPPDVVIVEGGTNDLGGKMALIYTPDEALMFFDTMIATIRNLLPTQPIIIHTIPPVALTDADGGVTDSGTGLFNAGLVAIAAKYNALFVDVGLTLADLSTDKLHTNYAAHFREAYAFWPILASLFPQ